MEHSQGQLKQFIVPIFKENVFLATGFVYKSWLITAGHVLKNVNPFGLTCVVENGKRYDIKPICQEYNQKEGLVDSFENYREDLAVFEVEMTLHSPIELLVYDNSLNNCEVEYLGFRYDEEVEDYPTLVSMKGFIKPQVTSDNYNNLLMTDVEKAVEGMSGGPVFVKNKVVGMLVNSYPVRNICKLISAKHIAEVIACLEDNSEKPQ